MENEKIIIIGPSILYKQKLQLANRLITQNSDLSIINSFITDESFNQNQNSSTSWQYYIPYMKVKESFKNNAIIYCTIDESNSDITKGIMLDDWYNGDIAVMNFIDFNNISNKIFSEYTDSLFIVWLDTNANNTRQQYDSYYDRESDIRESHYTESKIDSNSINVLYFNINHEHISDIANTVLEYYNTNNKDIRDKIISDNM